MPDLTPSSPLSVVEFYNNKFAPLAHAPDNEETAAWLTSEQFLKHISGDGGAWYDEYQDYLDRFNSAKAVSELNEDTVNDFVKQYAKGEYNSLDPGAVQTLINYYQTEAMNNSVRDFASRSNQIMVEDLKKAGLNPALLGMNPQGMFTVSGSSFAGGSNITTSARDKANIEYKYKALSVKQMLAATAIAVNGISKVLSSATSLIKPFSR